MGMKALTKHKFYVLNFKGWFYYTDGHYSHTDDFHQASGTSSLVEAKRMATYSKEQGGDNPAVVTVQLNLAEVNTQDIERAFYDSAVKKLRATLTDEELKVLRIEL